jgi:predicted DNA-binding transcriptional regulator AlpA
MPSQTKAAEKKTRPALVRPADLPELISRGQIMDLLQISYTKTLRDMVARARFPKPIEFNARLHRWSRAAVAERLATHRTQPEEPDVLDGWGSFLRGG